MPGFHHPVTGALGSNREAIQLAGKSNREVADVDHLLDLAKPLLHDFARLKRDQPSQGLLAPAQLLAEQADQFTPSWCGNVTPGPEGFNRSRDLRLQLGGRIAAYMPKNRPIDRAVHRQVTARNIVGRNPERFQCIGYQACLRFPVPDASCWVFPNRNRTYLPFNAAARIPDKVAVGVIWSGSVTISISAGLPEAIAASKASLNADVCRTVAPKQPKARA